MPAVVAGVVAAGYACYASVGRHVLGFLPEYAKEEGLESGSRYFLLTLARHGLHWETLPTGAFYAFAALLLLGLALWAWFTSEAGAVDRDSLFFCPRDRSHVAVFLPLSLVLPVVAAICVPDPLRAHALFHHRVFLPLHHLSLLIQAQPCTTCLNGYMPPRRCWRCGAWAPVGWKRDCPAGDPAPQNVCHLCEELMSESLSVLPQQDMRRYFEKPEDQLSVIMEADPVCLYLETTNRCNLLCTTCPRTFEELEPEKDMSWELFTSIIDQYPKIARVVLHGVGEPMLVKELPRMIRYLKDRGVYVLFNTNGTLLTKTNGQALIDAGLDELRVSLDAAESSVFQMVRGKDMFDRIVTNVGNFIAMQRRANTQLPRVSLWLTGLRETLAQLEAFIRLAHRLGVMEVYLQRMVYLPEGQGLARPESALFEHTTQQEERGDPTSRSGGAGTGRMFSASGATEPQVSIKKRKDDSPWSLCRRPWSLMYITANGQALPCCIAPFSMRGYDSFTLGNATQQTMREIWNGEKYQEFRRALLSPQPPSACSNCGCAGASDLAHRVSVVIPALNEAENIAAVVREMPWNLIRECIVVDNGSTDATASEAKAAGARVVAGPSVDMAAPAPPEPQLLTRVRHSGLHGRRRQRCPGRNGATATTNPRRGL